MLSRDRPLSLHKVFCLERACAEAAWNRHAKKWSQEGVCKIFETLYTIYETAIAHQVLRMSSWRSLGWTLCSRTWLRIVCAMNFATQVPHTCSQILSLILIYEIVCTLLSELSLFTQPSLLHLCIIQYVWIVVTVVILMTMSEVIIADQYLSWYIYNFALNSHSLTKDHCAWIWEPSTSVIYSHKYSLT